MSARFQKPAPVSVSGDLSSLLEDAFQSAYDDEVERIKALRGLEDVTASIPDAAAQYGEDQGGDLITGIDETTRERISEIIAQAEDDGLSDPELAAQLDDEFAFGDARAQLIARTEGQTAWNQGTLAALSDAGEQWVVVSDPDLCGEAICDVDGEIWTIEDAQAEPLGHPNCGRDFRPLDDEELAQKQAEDEADQAQGFSQRFYSEDQPRDEKGRWTSGGAGAPSELEKHLVDYKADRSLTGPDSAKITSVIPGTSHTNYLDVPHIDLMHDAMGLHPTMQTPTDVYTTTRDHLFEKLPISQVPISSLTFTQPRVNLPRVKALSHLPAQLSIPVQVVRVGGQNYLMNGHHRVVAGHVAGHDDIAAQVLDLGHKFYSEAQPRDDHGRWTSSGVGEGERAWKGESKATHVKMVRGETGVVGQRVVLDYLKHDLGFTDARPMNVTRNNDAIDMVQDHGAIEIKAGLVSNGPSAQQWRVTFSTSAKERAWMARATGQQVKEFNAAKMKAAMQRKENARRELEKELGKPVKAWTYGVIIDPDKQTADIYRFAGFHERIGWNTDMAKKGYLATVKLGTRKRS